MASECSNHFKYQLAIKLIDFATDSFKVCLMESGFTFDLDVDATWADISAEELATGNGYTQDTKTLTGVAVTENDTNDRVDVTWTNPSWTASGGSIGPTPGAIVYDDTTADNTVVGYLDFTTERTATDGGTFEIDNVIFRNT